jgi:hypothetical protein
MYLHAARFGAPSMCVYFSLTTSTSNNKAQSQPSMIKQQSTKEWSRHNMERHGEGARQQPTALWSPIATTQKIHSFQ